MKSWLMGIIQAYKLTDRVPVPKLEAVPLPLAQSSGVQSLKSEMAETD